MNLSCAFCDNDFSATFGCFDFGKKKSLMVVFLFFDSGACICLFHFKLMFFNLKKYVL